MSGIRLIAGLGNPGKEYEGTRHNAGFWFVDALARQLGASLKRQARFFGQIGKADFDAETVWLLEPTTYMNLSGKAVASVANFYRIAPQQILVVHDELDLLPGTSKMKLGGGHAGHNGLKDIQAQLGVPGFWRLRLGIGHPRSMNLEQDVVDYVLHAPRRDERAAIESEIERALTVIPDAISGNLEAAMMKLHTRPRPPGGQPGPATP
jgi:peptidyl-tRNA hydrolase, PTH1 family